MRLEDRVGLGQNPVLLEPFGHQVAGRGSMLIVDAVTLCKPLIPREHFVYRTMPPQLLPFTPRYKGVLYVQLEEEEDGYLKLLGYYPQVNHDNDRSDVSPEVNVERDEDDRFLQAPSQFSSGASTPVSSGSELDMPSAVERSETPSGQPSGCVVRVLQCGTYEVSTSTTSDSRVFISQPHHHNDVNDRNAETAPRGSSEEAPQSPAAVIHPLNPWGFSCHTRLLDKMRKSKSSLHGCPFLKLENVVARFARPCILDLKVGSRLHDDHASQQKIASQSAKVNSTTSKSLGLRLCGMQVYQVDTGAYKSLDKFHGRKLTDTTFRAVLWDFLHNGDHLRRELLAPILSRLTDLVNTLEEIDSFRFYASSLLIMYDGVCEDVENNRRPQQKRSTERMYSGEKRSAGGSQQDRMSSRHRLPQVRVTSDQADDVNRDALNKSRWDSRDHHSGEECSPSVASDTASSATLQGSSDTLRRSAEHCEASNFTTENGNVQGEQALVDVRMIDFAHTTHNGFPDDRIQHEGPDRDYISGLQNLISLFSELSANTA